MEDSDISRSLTSALAGRVSSTPSSSHASSITGETAPEVATLMTWLPRTACSTLSTAQAFMEYVPSSSWQYV